MHRYLKPEEQQQLLSAAQRVNDPLAFRDYHVMGALLHSGMRIGEFSLITRGDVLESFKPGYLYIPAENRKGGKRDHRVYMTKALRLHLVALLNLSDGDDSSAPLVPGRFGAPMTVRAYQLRIQHWADEAGLPMRVTPHFFRHTRAMNIMRSSESKDPRAIVQSVLNHASIATTGIYTQPSREEIESTLDNLDGNCGRRPSLAKLRQNYNRRAG